MLMAEALKQSDKYVWYGALFAAAMSLGAGLTVRPRPHTPRRSRSTLHGDASWMPMKQVARLLPETGGIVIGERYRVDRDDVANVDFDPKNPFTWGRGGRARLVTYDLAAFPAGSTHGLVFAGSGGFKTVSTVVSTCLRWTGGMVCLDPTREVADMVKTVRGQGGRAVAILDPRHPEFGFNVLDWIGTGRSTAEEDVATVVGWLTTESPDQGGNSRFFELSSEQLLTGVDHIPPPADQHRQLGQRLAPGGHRGRLRGPRVDVPRVVVRVSERAVKACLTRQRGLAGPVRSGDEGEPRHSRSSGLAEERRQGLQNPLVALGLKRDLLAPPVGIFLDDPGREPPIAVLGCSVRCDGSSRHRAFQQRSTGSA